jgi:hypothetical protein
MLAHLTWLRLALRESPGKPNRTPRETIHSYRSALPSFTTASVPNGRG